MAGREKRSVAEEQAHRERIREVVNENLEKHLQALLDQAENAQKEDWVLCPHCNRKHPVSRPDYRAQESAIRTLHELGYGKPKVEGRMAARGLC
jgi:hypothetical protein